MDIFTIFLFNIDINDPKSLIKYNYNYFIRRQKIKRIQLLFIRVWGTGSFNSVFIIKIKKFYNFIN